jgi:hypothetical protein
VGGDIKILNIMIKSLNFKNSFYYKVYNAPIELLLICLYPSLSFVIYFIPNDKFKIMIWNKVGFVLASKVLKFFVLLLKIKQ